MKSYICHKEVKATQIIRTLLSDPSILHCADGASHPRPPSGSYEPSYGDYLIEYADGCRSISPRKAFEEGYTLKSDLDDITQHFEDFAGKSNGAKIEVEGADFGNDRLCREEALRQAVALAAGKFNENAIISVAILFYGFLSGQISSAADLKDFS